MSFTESFRAPLLAVTALATTGAGCVDIVATGGIGYVEREEKRFSVEGRPEVALSTFDGAIEVRPWDQPQVLVEIEKHALDEDLIGDIEVRAEQNGNRVSVEVRVKSGSSHWGRHRSARLTVSLPATSDVIAKTGDGAIDVEGVSGRIDLRSGDGAIRGHELSGDVSARTGDGSIRLDRIDGRLDMNTGDGSIVAAGRFTSLRARSGDGSVRIQVEPGSTALEDWDVVTGDGSVTVDFPDRFDAELDAHTGDGHVSISGRILSRTTESTRRAIRGRLGEGGHSFRVRSGDGSIRLGRS
jgi:putative adhesin